MTSSDIAEAWKKLSGVFQANPGKARAKYAAATAVVDHGLLCRVTGPAGEHIETDMPAAMGGSGSRPNPGWYFRASIAACCSTVIAARAAILGINLTRLEVTVEGEGDHRGMLGLDDSISAGHSTIQTTVRINSDNATPDQLKELAQWAEAHSPVGCNVNKARLSTLNVIVT
jgi:uncharacterized OsmC-like protein